MGWDRKDAPKYVHLEDLVPIIDPFPRRAFRCDTSIVEEDTNLDTEAQRMISGHPRIHTSMTAKEKRANAK